jgi:drug/metabolite transporter (DMT)-like permease
MTRRRAELVLGAFALGLLNAASYSPWSYWALSLIALTGLFCLMHIARSRGASTAMQAVLAFAFGQPIVPLVIVTLAVVVIGVVLSSVAPDPAPIEHERPHLAVVLALVCAASFGLSLYATGHLSGELPLGLVMLPPRLTGVVLLAIPLAASRRLQITRRTAPLVVTMGIAEVIGYICLTIASRDDVAVASVLVSQFAPIAAVVAFLLFKERLGRLQIAGLVVIIIGVVGLSIVQTTT